MRWLLWLTPGLGIKRWLVVFSLGLALLTLGTTIILNTALLASLELSIRRLVYGITGQFLPARLIGALFALAGAAVVAWSVRRTIRAAVAAAPAHGQRGVAAALVSRGEALVGPRVVAVGGGTGLATLVRGLKTYTDNITAIVTMTDDGGSSGRLRSETGILPPGDLRNVIVALADAEPLMESLFQHRFRQGSLAGHSFGNLYILAMSEILGDFEQAVRESSKVLAVRGRVVPSTLDRVDLVATLEDGQVVRGESAITAAPGRVVDLRLDPPDPRPHPQALEALAAADLIVVGPGSLYTSLLPTLLMPQVAAAVRGSGAPRVFVVNVMTQAGETDGFAASDHLRVVHGLVGGRLFDWAVVNTARAEPRRLEPYRLQSAEPVVADVASLVARGIQVVSGDLLAARDLVRHDPDLLARAVLRTLLQHPRRGRRLLADLLLAERLARPAP